VLDIYIGNLPARATVTDVRALVDGVVGEKLLGANSASGVGARLRKPLSFLSRLLQSKQQAAPEFTLVEDKAGQFARYVRISGSSRLVAKHIITQLSGAGLHGHALHVRPFYPRILTNERRRAGWRFRRWLGAERRVAERRADVN
jgi:hypothetical protein